MQNMQALVPRMADAVAHTSKLNKTKTVLSLLRHEETKMLAVRAAFEQNLSTVMHDVAKVIASVHLPLPTGAGAGAGVLAGAH